MGDFQAASAALWVLEPVGRLSAEERAVVLTLPGPTSWVDLDVLLRTSYYQWPAAVIESVNGLPAQRLMDACRSPTFAAHIMSCQEFLLYDSEAAFLFWRDHGQTREFESSLILVDFQAAIIRLTVAHDNSSSSRVATIALDAITRHRDIHQNSVGFWHLGPSARQIGKKRQ